MEKEELREALRKARTSLSDAEVARSGRQILNFAKKLPWKKNWLLYAPIHKEVPTEDIFHWVHSQGGETFYPLMKSQHIVFQKVNSLSELRPGKWVAEPRFHQTGVFPPEAAHDSYVLVPGLCFSRTGDRIGYGKGFYDRFLKENPLLLRIGLAYDFQIQIQTWKPGRHDQKMDFVVTPNGLWSSPWPRI